MICTIQNNEITVECNVKLDNTSYCAKSISVVKIDHDKVFIAYSTNVKSVHAVMCTISDTTISLGTIKQIGGNYIYGDVHSAILLSENKIIVLHDEYVSTNVRKIYGIVCTISGTTITNGADTLLNSSSYAGFNTSAIKLSDNRIFIAHGRADFNLYASIYEITDTTITVVTDSTVISTNIHTSTPISTIKLSDNKVFIAGINANSLYAIICSINGALIEQGVEILLGDSNTYKISTLNLSENKLLIIQGGVNPLLGTICTIDGTNIILDKNISLNEEKESGWVIAAINLIENKIFVAYNREGSVNTTLYAMILTTLNEVKNIKNSIDEIFGIAKTKGTEGQTVKVYVPKLPEYICTEDENRIITENGEEIRNE